MNSNCYVVYDEDTKKCLVIDPGSEESKQEIAFIEDRGLILDFIILTHEHTDHNWGVNSLRNRYAKVKLVCSQECNNRVRKTNRVYFLLYFDNPDYRYEIASADMLISHPQQRLEWNSLKIGFVLSPGHSRGSMCVDIGGMLFTGDTIMPYKPYFNGRDSNRDDWMGSIARIHSLYKGDTIIYPGHGDKITLKEWINSFSTIV